MIIIMIIIKLDSPAVTMDETCYRIELASDGARAVERCSCGSISVHIGGLTVRITDEDLEGLATTLGVAALRNRGIQEELGKPHLHVVTEESGLN